MGVEGKTKKACLETLTNSYSRFLKIQKVAVKKSKFVFKAMVKLIEHMTKHTVTPDRGKEFTNHQELNNQLKIEVYFLFLMLRGKDDQENTNGLLRGYVPKGSYLTLVDVRPFSCGKTNLIIGHGNVLTGKYLMKSSMKKMRT